ncbi:MAG TPA: carbohydrate-binding protein [Clostridia bacterium]|nr:carbohydrate-binding protein [Clostridia bacterium]
MANKRQNFDYVENGVAISPAVPMVGDRVKIIYDGILSKNGATGMNVHLGYGANMENEQDIPMERSETCYEATVPALRESYLKLSFRDQANNVDDNSGSFYSFDITG